VTLVPLDDVAEGTVLFVCATRKPAPGSTQRSAIRGLLSGAASTLSSVYPDVAMLDLREVDLPFFDGRTIDAPGGGDLSRVHAAIARAGALLVSAPIYWAGVSGVFKNLIDVLCGPAYDLPRPIRSIFTDKPVGVLVVCARAEDAVTGTKQTIDILSSVGARLVGDPVVVADPRAPASLPAAATALIAVAGQLAQLAHAGRRAKDAG
jgi:NAD(P)H-dependent FMN reductase